MLLNYIGLSKEENTLPLSYIGRIFLQQHLAGKLLSQNTVQVLNGLGFALSTHLVPI